MRPLYNHLKSLAKSPNKSLYLILLFGLFLRVLLLLAAPGLLWPDSFDYYRSAVAIADGFDFRLLPIYRTPGYSVFLAIFLLLGRGHSTGIAIIAIQHIFGLLSTYFVYKTAERIFNKPVAIVTGLLSAGHTLFLYYETVIHTESLFLCLLTGTIYYVTLILDQPREAKPFKQFAVLGILAGCLTLVRPIGQLLLLAILLLFLIKFKDLKKWLKLSTCCLAIYGVILMPWMMRNLYHHNFFGLSKDLGINLYHRVIDVDQQSPIETTKYRHVKRAYENARKKSQITYFHVLRALEGRRYSPRTVDNLMAKVAIERIKETPQIYFENSLYIFYKLFFKSRYSIHFCASERGKYLCSPRTRHLYRSTLSQKPFTGFNWAKKFVYQYFKKVRLPIGFLTVLAVVGCYQITRDDKRFRIARMLCICTVLYFALLTALLNREEDRFRLPVDGYIFMLAAYGGHTIVKRLRPSLEQRQSPTF